MKHDIFNKIEKELMKILTRSPGVFKSQYDLYSELLEEFDDIKDPIEKDNFKIRFLLVLRKLPSIFDDIVVKNKNGILSAIYSIESLDKTLETDSYEKIDTNDISMPSEIAVIRFIVDEKIEKYYSKKDYLNNTLLHYLVNDSDYERINKIMGCNTLNLSFLDENDEGKTPLDLIKDIRISNLFIKELIKNNTDNFNKIGKLEIKYKDLESEIVNINTYMVMTRFIVMIMFCYIGYTIFT
jgi:hypothetical protein